MNHTILESTSADRISDNISASLPRAIFATARAQSLLRDELEANDRSHYFVVACRDLELHDIDQHLPQLLDDSSAASDLPRWRHAPSLLEPVELDRAAQPPLSILTHRGGTPQQWNGGFLHLPRFEAIIGRWYFLTPEREEYSASITLIGAANAECINRLRLELQRLRRRRALSAWQVINGASYLDDPSSPRDLPREDDLIFAPALRERIAIDVLRFFSDNVATLYRSLGVPQRRGVLLYGPPGNGKTSLIRWIGASLPNIPAMLLRPRAGFDSDDLKEVIRRWKRQAPAILVIEDLDWLVKEVSVSHFLNLLDGIDTNTLDAPALLLIATTNHPEKLDPAINSRPGRFDVVIEVPSPSPELRRDFLQAKLPAMDDATLEEAVRKSERFSFAHLHEILRLSGLYAIAAGRTERNGDDIRRAVSEMANLLSDADRGFAPKPDMPFGLEALRLQKRERKKG